MRYSQLVSIIFLIGFVSIYVQWQGLYGHNGLLPVDIYLSDINQRLNTNNSLEKFLQSGNFLLVLFNSGLTVEVLCEWTLLLGIFSSVISIFYSSTILHFINWICYLTVVNSGQVFTSFQWDILLLETGFLLVINNFFNNDKQNNWSTRFLIWKLMFCSGVVKVQSNCPTWNKLTALEYHFVSQCLPTFISWYMNQLPPIILRFFVAMTLLIEIPLTFMLICPLTQIRRIGVYLQVILQMSIIISGNYTFFNLLTLVLLYTCYVCDHDDNKLAVGDNINNLDIYQFYKYILKLIDVSKPGKLIQITVSCFFICISFVTMISYKTSPTLEWWRGEQITLLMKSKQLDQFIFPGCVIGIVTCILHVIIENIISIKKIFHLSESVHILVYKLVFNQCHSILLVFWLVLSSSSLSSISPNYSQYIPKYISNITKTYPYFHIVSSYGLFRKMTGVGPDIQMHLHDKAFTISSVRRPEIILEGYDNDQSQWLEIPFKYKPSYINKTPQFIAPHQPRLDWQMWFAALGSYQYNPWLIKLINILLSKKINNEVINLLDSSNYPFIKKPPQYIRATLYHYDFTKYHSTNWPWINTNYPGNENVTFWWYRYDDTAIEYIPPIEYNNPSVESFLHSHGLSTRPYKSIIKQYSDCKTLESKFVRNFNNYLPDWLSIKIHTILCSIILIRSEKYNKYYNIHVVYLIVLTILIAIIIHKSLVRTRKK